MAKRLFLFLVFAIAAAGGVFARGFSISAGAGEYFTSDFGGGIESSASGKTETPYAGGGGFIFLDAAYAEFSLGIFGAGGTFEGQSNKSSMTLMGLDIGLLGKYPFSVNDRISLFPLLGITYRAMLSAKDADKNQYKNSGGGDAGAGDFSALWFKLGGGLDFFVTDKIYIRCTESYGMRLANGFEKNADKSLPGHGFEMRFSVGYRF
ncbi:MAG: hypothetical protein LBI94_01685 [Treponema sp.]|jgi:hypothetical protein|nr:hypothetical protein [Treponema sp.]